MSNHLSVSSGLQIPVPSAFEGADSTHVAAAPTNPAIVVDGAPLELTPLGEGVIAAKQKYTEALKRDASKPMSVSQVPLTIKTGLGPVETVIIGKEADEAKVFARDAATLLTQASPLAASLKSSLHETEADSLLSSVRDSATLAKEIAAITPFSPNKEVAAFLKKYAAAVKEDARLATERLSSMKESHISGRSLPARDASDSLVVDALLNYSKAKTFLELQAAFGNECPTTSLDAVASGMHSALAKADASANQGETSGEESPSASASLSHSSSSTSLSGAGREPDVFVGPEKTISDETKPSVNGEDKGAAEKAANEAKVMDQCKSLIETITQLRENRSKTPGYLNESPLIHKESEAYQKLNALKDAPSISDSLKTEISDLMKKNGIFVKK